MKELYGYIPIIAYIVLIILFILYFKHKLSHIHYSFKDFLKEEFSTKAGLICFSFGLIILSCSIFNETVMPIFFFFLPKELLEESVRNFHLSGIIYFLGAVFFSAFNFLVFCLARPK